MRPHAEPAVRRAGRGWSEPAPWRVAGARRETHDVVTLALEPAAGTSFAFQAGQFNMVYAPGVGEVPVSISGDPARPTPVLHTIRDVGPVSHALCALRAGEVAGVRGPYGTAWPLDRAVGRDVVIVAGGLGLPPLRGAIYHVLAHRGHYGRVVLLYGARTPADLLFTDELARWRSRLDLEVEVTVDAGTVEWRGDVGVVPDFIRPARFDADSTTAFVVGPEIMMRFTVRALLAAGVPADQVIVSLERNTQCAVGMCGHCQLGPFLLCRDGPVLSHQAAGPWLRVREM